MYHEQNNLNQNNFNTQGNNGIPNNQPLNNNNFKPSKKNNMGLIIGIVSTVIIIGIIGGTLLLSDNFKTTNKGNNNSDNIENNDTKTEENDIVSSEIDKYWNINTKEFDASLFDGKFSICGNIIQSKLTGKALNENGYKLRIGSGLFQNLLWDEENKVYSDKSNGAYILKNNEELIGNIYLENYKNETNLYSDNTEVSYYWNDISEKYNEIIIPTCLIANSEELVSKTLTVDKIVDKLGAPTYVQGRLTKSIEEGQFFKYVYVYNDYTLWFEMLYYEKLGITVTGFRYEGNQAFNQPCKYYDANKAEFRNYDKSLDYLIEEQTKYEKSL